MQESLRQISDFLTSPDCIFDFGKFDFPTSLQQKMINSYLNIKRLLLKPYPEIMRMFHTATDKVLETIVMGITYHILINN